jgi:hypothetical protein
MTYELKGTDRLVIRHIISHILDGEIDYATSIERFLRKLADANFRTRNSQREAAMARAVLIALGAITSERDEADIESENRQADSWNRWTQGRKEGDRLFADNCPDCLGVGYHIVWSYIGNPPERESCQRCGGTGRRSDAEDVPGSGEDQLPARM